MKRIFHRWDKWECYKSGFYKTIINIDNEEAKNKYALFLSDSKRFENALKRVLNEWFFSCEHFLSNESMNRIAWLGQASVCIETGIPSCFRGGFKLISIEKQKEADKLALKYLKIWLKKYEKEDKQLYLFMEKTGL